MKKIDCTALVLLLIAALNCGVMAVFNFDMIDALLESSFMDRIANAIFGLAAIYVIVSWRGIKARWMSK